MSAKGSPRRAARSLPLGDSRIVDRVESWWRHAGGQPAQERERIHVNRDRAVSVSLFQGDANQAVGALLHSLLRNRGAQDVSQQRLSTPGVEAPRAGGCVQGEPIKRCAERLVVGECSEPERPETARPARSLPSGDCGPAGGDWPESAQPGLGPPRRWRGCSRDRLHRSARGHGPRPGCALVLASKKATAVEVPLDSPDGVLQHIAHLAGLQMSKARKERAAWPRATSSFPCSCQAPSSAIVWR